MPAMRRASPLLPILLLLGCSSQPAGDPGVGLQPDLPEPTRTLIPTVDIAPAPVGGRPSRLPPLIEDSGSQCLEHPRGLPVRERRVGGRKQGPAGKAEFAGSRAR